MLCGVPFPVFYRWQSLRIAGIYSQPVVVDKNITEDDAFYLLTFKPVGRYPVYLFLLESGEKALHSGIVEAVTGPTETLDYSAFLPSLNASLVYWLPPVGMKNSTIQITAVRLQLSDSVYTEFFLHVVTHFQCYYFLARALQEEITVHPNSRVQHYLEKYLVQILGELQRLKSTTADEPCLHKLESLIKVISKLS